MLRCWVGLLALCATSSASREATAVLYSSSTETSGTFTVTVMGYVEFNQESADDYLIIKIVLLENNSSLTDGEHGIHIHNYGNTWGGCTSAVGHYNPLEVDHGGPDDDIRHVGDLGNIEIVDNAYTGTISDTVASLYGQYSILGRGVVLHSGEDDLGKGTGDLAESSKATGNAGSRVACGVIGVNSEGFDSAAFRHTATYGLVLCVTLFYLFQ